MLKAAFIHPSEVTFRSGLFLFAALLLSGCDASGPQPEAETAAASPAGTARLDRSRAATPAPDVAFQDPDGEPATLADFRGKPLLLNLWATWCAPCIAEMPTLDALAEREPGLQVLALSQDLEGRGKVTAFFEERKFKKLEPYLDPQIAMMSALKVDTLPATILFDAEGREVWRMTGKEDWTGEPARKLLAEAMSPAANPEGDR